MSELAAFVAPLSTLDTRQWVGCTAAVLAVMAVLLIAFLAGRWSAYR